MGVPINIVQKGCELAIHGLNIDLCVTMGWVDVPNSDRDVFKRQHDVCGACFVISLVVI